MLTSACSPCRCGWRWPGSWVSGCPSGSWARAWTTSTTCSRPSSGADMCFLSDRLTCKIQTALFSIPCLLDSRAGTEGS